MIFGPAGGSSNALRLRHGRGRRGSGRRQIALRDRVAALVNGETLEDIAPAQKEPRGWVRENHFAGAETLALRDSRFFQVNEAGFRARDQQAVVRERVAHRPQAVAIELGTNKFAVGENEGGGPVPRLALLRKRAQSAAHIAREQRVFLEGRRNHGEHGLFRGQPFEQSQLKTVIETRGIADVFFQDGKPRAHRKPRTNFALLGAQPAAVRDDGIDLAVMRDVAERLRQMPGRLGVRGITLVKNGEGGLERRVAQVFIKLGELPRRQETFIDNRL